MRQKDPLTSLSSWPINTSMNASNSNASAVSLCRERYGAIDGQPVDLFTFSNPEGVTARITNYGGIIVSVLAPDRAGRKADVVLGFDSLDEYVRLNTSYLGAVIGRYGNRIAQGRFVLDGKAYELAINNGPNHLHGGLKGFDKRIWNARILDSSRGPTLELTYVSPDGEEGYPGNLEVTALYSLSASNTLRLEVSAQTDQPTIINITQHSYFNLAGSGTVLDHEVTLNASRYLPTDATAIPLGPLEDVAGSPFDFRTPTAIGARQDDPHPQRVKENGYDHTFVIDKESAEFALHAQAVDPGSGRKLILYSTAPGVQFYTGNFLDGSLKGKQGSVYHRHHGFCFEPQHFPDSPNRPEYPSVVLRPGETYRHNMEYTFTVA